MYEVREKRRKLLDGTEITTYTRDVVSANILTVEAGTTGYMGGDSGHGSRTYLRVKDLASTDIRCNVEKDKFGCKSIEIILGGDAELETMKEALRWMLSVLETQSEMGG